MKIVALGTSCVDIYPQKETVTPGGEALNIAAHIAPKTDGGVFLMGQIGNDDYGKVILESINGLKIDLQHLYQVAGETAHHIIHIREDGDRYFEEGAWHGGVSSDFRLNDSDRKLINDSHGVITTLWEPNLNELISLKKKSPYTLAVDFNEQRDFGHWDDLIGDLDIFFISGEESLYSDFLHRSLNSDTVYVLTLAEKGSKAFYQGKEYYCPAVNVSNVVDTTGCGDCYQGNFLVEYIRSRDISKAMKVASEEAAKVTSYVGGFQVCDS